MKSKDRAIFDAIAQSADRDRLAKLAGFDRREIDNFFIRVADRLWRGEVKQTAAVKKLVINVDGASRGNPGPAAAGVVLRDEDGTVIDAFGRHLGECTNNVAEYRALVIALERASEFGARVVEVKTDSQLMEKQMKRQYRVKNHNLVPLYERATALAGKFDSFDISHVGREENSYADSLANKALDKLKKNSKKAK